MYVCMYVCIYIHTYVCMHVCMYIYSPNKGLLGLEGDEVYEHTLVLRALLPDNQQPFSADDNERPAPLLTDLLAQVYVSYNLRREISSKGHVV